MGMTALIVELLVVGVGTMTWIYLLLAASFTISLPSNPILAVPITAVIYVVGVISDRLYRKVSFVLMEKKYVNATWADNLSRTNHKRELTNLSADNAMVIEKFIRFRSDQLGRKIDYNRSRLRVCRAWTINMPLIGISFIIWSYFEGLFENFLCSSVLSLVFTMICTLACWKTAITLSQDHINDLVESYEVVKNDELFNENQHLEGIG